MAHYDLKTLKMMLTENGYTWLRVEHIVRAQYDPDLCDIGGWWMLDTSIGRNVLPKKLNHPEWANTYVAFKSKEVF